MTEEKSSTHKCEVVPVVLEKHPNADSLSIVRVFGYQVCVRTDAWGDKALGAYVVPDSVVDVSRPEFAFLAEMSDNKGKTHVRIRAKKLRGVPSYGLLIPVPEGVKEGDDVAELLGVERYVPPEERNSHGAAQGYVTTKAIPIPGPDVQFHIPDYHVDAFQRYAKGAFVDGEMVYVSEKIDGANSRYMWDGQRMHIGSHHRWLEPEGVSMWHKILEVRPEIKAFCMANPNLVLFGEVFGFVQDLHYGMSPGEINFIAFDVMDNGRWMNVLDMTNLVGKFDVPTAPFIAQMPYDFDQLMAMAEGPSLYGLTKHYREGVVVRPLIERTEFRIGRVQLKIVSMNYLEAGGKEKPYKAK